MGKSGSYGAHLNLARGRMMIFPMRVSPFNFAITLPQWTAPKSELGELSSRKEHLLYKINYLILAVNVGRLRARG